MPFSLDWIHFSEVPAEDTETPLTWGEEFSIVSSTTRLSWILSPTTTLVNARYRGIRESEKNNQFMLDVSHDLAVLYARFAQLEGRFSMVRSTKDDTDYILPTENELTVHLEGDLPEEDTNYTMWWDTHEDLRILTKIDQESEDRR